MPRDFTEQLTEGFAYAEATPQTLNSSNVSTTAINMAIMRRARGFISVGTIASSGSLNAYFTSSATQTGSYVQITGEPTTQPSITGITTAGQPNSIEIRADQMPVGQPWLKLYVVETSGNNVVVHPFIVADCSCYSPGNQEDNVTWTNKVVTA